MSKWSFDIIPNVGALPIKFGMSLEALKSLFAEEPYRIVDEGHGNVRIIFGDIVMVYLDEFDSVFGITFSLFGDKTIRFKRDVIIDEEYWLPSVENLIESLGKFEIREGAKFFSDVGVTFPYRIDSEDTSDQSISIEVPDLSPI